MKTTVVLDDQLLKDAIEAIHAKSKKEAIEAGLRELVMKKNRSALISELGSYDLDISLEELEEMRGED
ncbi:MAG: type II toxin-antitoxin system VapB family antitoxin [bacterium]|nr:type II toxin-antitoxin system VapB family antitoxin [bacterium]